MVKCSCSLPIQSEEALSMAPKYMRTMLDTYSTTQAQSYMFWKGKRSVQEPM